jgi:hypothetical protein
LKVAILSRESAIKGDFYMGNQTETFKEILERDGTLVYKTKGISMLPMLRTNKDVIIIRAKKPGEIFKKYDVALFLRDNGQYVLHRITKVGKDHYMIRGDNCRYTEYVREDQVLGILDTFIRDGKDKIESTDLKYRIYYHLRVWDYPIRRAKCEILVAIKKMLGMDIGPIPE